MRRNRAPAARSRRRSERSLHGRRQQVYSAGRRDRRRRGRPSAASAPRRAGAPAAGARRRAVRSQVIYNIHFHGKILWWMKLMYELSLKAGRRPTGTIRNGNARQGGYGSGARWHLRIAVEKNDSSWRSGVSRMARIRTQRRNGTKVSATLLVRTCRALRTHGNCRTAGTLWRGEAGRGTRRRR